jgi:outer membrane protein assembly factor BamB
VPPACGQEAGPDTRATLARIGSPRGLCLVLGDPRLALDLARHSELRVCLQSPDADQVHDLCREAEAAGLLGKRLFVQRGSWSQLHLASNLADAVVVRGAAAAGAPPTELLRVVRPGGTVITPDGTTAKPVPEGIDEWSHPYHGPDNNPQSQDRLARAPYLTHFLAEPWYSPMPLMTVASGGRLFKAFGHIAVKEREWPLLNTLVAQNAYNGTILWQRPLREGYVIHRNTLIATPETVYLGDDRSCKLLDAATGELKGEIVVPAELRAGPAWKWMALVNGTLYALVGPEEEPEPTLRGNRMARGWPWRGGALGRGYDSEVYRWGFGQTLLALDPATRKVHWSHRESDPIDGRATCLAAGRLFFYSHKKFVGAIDTATGKLLWKTSDPTLLAAIGEHKYAQNPKEGFSTTAYVKADDQALLFAGPNRENLLAVAARDGRLLWQAAGRGNSQLVLRDDGLYALGVDQSDRYEVRTGKVLQSFGPRVNCTRATGSIDSLFVRGGRDGTIRYDLVSNQAEHICPMRPSCQDGVLAVFGHLYWGPWMCDCNLTLIGVIALEPAGIFDFAGKVNPAERLQRDRDHRQIAVLGTTPLDWPTFRADNRRSAFTRAAVVDRPVLRWTFTPGTALPATAPISAGGLVFVGGGDGSVRALDAATGQPRWTTFTGAALTYPPSVWQDRLYVGSGDGWVHTLEAATGRPLWRFRAAPAERTIPVYGSLRSTWPVASGTLVEDGTVYAAAGIANYDGTHVYALDAVTGSLRWHNGTSGRLHPETASGVSVNGHLLLHGGQLHLAGGNMVNLASYDLADGKCVTDPLAPASHTQFRAGSDLFTLGDRVAVSGFPLYSAQGDYRMVNQAVLQTPAGDVLAALGPHDCSVGLADTGAFQQPGAKPRWVSKPANRLYALAVTPRVVVLTGAHDPAKAGDPLTGSVQALSLADGQTLWKHDLPALPVSWGLAVDRNGQVIVTLQDGRVLCFGAGK